MLKWFNAAMDWGLGQEPLYRRLTLRGVSQHPLDRHLAVQPGVGRQQDLTHAAFAQRFLDLVPGQVHDLHVQISVTGQSANIRQRRLTTAAERGLITQTAIRRIGRLCTAFVRLLIAKAFVVVTWHSSGFPSAGFVKRVSASLHPLRVTSKPCRLHRHPDQHSRSLLAQFGLTPKSRRGLGAGEVV